MRTLHLSPMRARISLTGRHSSLWMGCLGFKIVPPCGAVVGHSVALLSVGYHTPGHEPWPSQKLELSSRASARTASRTSPPPGSPTSPRRAATGTSRVLDLRDYPMPFFNEVALAGLGAVDRRDREALADEDRRVRRLHHRRGGIQPRADRGAEERARLRLQGMEQQAGGLRRLRRCRCRARDRAAAAERGRAADGADPRRRAHPVPVYHGGPEGRKDARRLRLPAAERQGHARPVRLVGRCAEERAREPSAQSVRVSPRCSRGRLSASPACACR